MRSSLLALLVAGSAAASPPDRLAGELAAADRARDALAAKLDDRDRALAARVRALYKLSRAADAPVWAIGPDRAAAFRQAQAARRVILRDLEERRQIADDWVAASAAATRLEAAAAWVRFVRAPLPRHGWTRPVPGRIAAGFGRFREPTSGALLERTTVELAARPGWNVVSPRAGRVVFAGATRDGGVVLVAHDLDLVSALVGVVPTVVAGQVVDGGTVVGRAQGMRVGFSLRRGGRPIDPAPLWP